MCFAQAKEEETAATIASLAAELRRAKWEKSLAEERADALSKALAVAPGSSTAEVRTSPNTPVQAIIVFFGGILCAA